MTDNNALLPVHPEGESQKTGFDASGTVGSLDTFAGKVHVRWVPEAAVSSLGLLPYFIEFLKVSGRFEAWVADCPLEYTSGNAPHKQSARVARFHTGEELGSRSDAWQTDRSTGSGSRPIPQWC